MKDEEYNRGSFYIKKKEMAITKIKESVEDKEE